MNVYYEWTVPSFDRQRAHAGVEYSVRLLEGGTMTCSCPAFVNNVGTDCKHIKAVRQGKYLPNDVQTSGKTAPEEKHYTRRGDSAVLTVALFWYGNLWRVTRTVTSTDPNYSRVLDYSDKGYTEYPDALAVYESYTSR